MICLKGVDIRCVFIRLQLQAILTTGWLSLGGRSYQVVSEETEKNSRLRLPISTYHLLGA